LPDDIRILQCELCDEKFNSNKDSKSKEYHYYFCTDPIYNPVFNEFVTHIPSNSKASATEPLDIELMQRACKIFIANMIFIALRNEMPALAQPSVLFLAMKYYKPNLQPLVIKFIFLRLWVMDF